MRPKSGTHRSQTIIVKTIYTDAWKRFLNVSLRTPYNFVYGDLGRFSLVGNCCIRLTRYWFRLLKMDNSRLPYQAYKMFCTLNENGKKNWVTTVRQTLFHPEYGFVWLNHGVATEQRFIAQLKQRFMDVHSQEWMANLSGGTPFDTHIKYETYLDC